ncbi:MAG: DNA cytosine methyltransferase [Alphaproteobacteria bacterium]|nr:DNA cytosine methyltransferase [Alphaproteobacteria bacterium]
MYKIGSLFAGIGGVCSGFKQAGFDVAWANEWDKNACITYRNNFNHRLIEGDIHNLNPNDLEKVDIISSGFPCQAFSIAGYRKGFEDDRGDLFFETMRLVKAIRPKVIFCENVKNLLSHDKGNTIKVIEEEMRKAGYTFSYFVLNSCEYGNVPQNRERIYIIGFDKENKELSHITSKPEFILTEMLKPKAIPLQKTIHDMLDKDKQDELFYYNESKYYPILKEAMTNRDTIYQWRRVYVRENKSNLCPTLTANMGTGGHNVPLILDDYGIRKLTPRECSRFQGFSKDYKFPKGMANSHLYKQIGNAVSVPVIQRIADNIKTLLEHKSINKEVCDLFAMPQQEAKRIAV